MRHSKLCADKMRILIDSREQTPFAFHGERYKGISTEVTTLPTGDYSLKGLEDKVAIERKSMPDLVSCLGKQRERFLRELQRGKALEAFCVVIEGSFEQLAKGEYRSDINPHAACQSIAAFTARLGIPFFFAGSRAGAEYMAWSFLRQFLQGALRRYEAIIKAHGQEATNYAG